MCISIIPSFRFYGAVNFNAKRSIFPQAIQNKQILSICKNWKTRLNLLLNISEFCGNLLPRIFNKKKETTEKLPFCHIFYSIFITYLVSTKIYILFKELFIFHLTYFNVSIGFHFQFFCPIRLCMVAHHCQSKQIKIKNENQEIEKIKIILFRKNLQNYHGL